MFCIRTVLFLYILGCLKSCSDAITSEAANVPCSRLKDCSHIYNLKRDTYGAETLLLLLHCYVRHSQIYIKCIDPSTVKDFIERADLIPAYEQCGLENAVPKISGGEATDIDDFPWIALLKYRTKTGEIKYGCHGNLITSRYLLTAAHCVEPKETLKKINGNVYSVVLGEYNINTKEDCIDSDCAEDIKEIKVENYTIHPDYNLQTYVNDIALIRMESEVTFSDFIKPVCLPPKNSYTSYEEVLLIAGWGNTEKNVMNPIKVQARFKLRQRDSCVVNVNLTSKQFCAASTHNAQTCPGDSGGPLMMRRTISSNNRLFLVGVDSLGAGCFFSSNISIYTKVSPYIEWIVTTIHK